MSKFKIGDRVRVKSNDFRATLNGLTGVVVEDGSSNTYNEVRVDLDENSKVFTTQDRFGWGFYPESLERAEWHPEQLDWTKWRVLDA